MKDKLITDLIWVFAAIAMLGTIGVLLVIITLPTSPAVAERSVVNSQQTKYQRIKWESKPMYDGISESDPGYGYVFAYEGHKYIVIDSGHGGIAICPAK
jgi:N-acetylmuramoyl-L-alanine amidase